jgi:hypothetical protein
MSILYPATLPKVFFRKIYKSLAKLTKRKKRRLKLIKLGTKDMINTNEIQRIISEHFENLYLEINKFLDAYGLPKLN